MHDYLSVIITSADGTKEWQGQSIAVPRVGDDITVRNAGGDEVFGGTVGNVHWGYRENALGVVASVWLKD